MSLERAKKFCRLCHYYSSLTPDAENPPGLDSIGLYGLRDRATAEAMRALEALGRQENDIDSDSWIRSQKALSQCEGCDYSSPRIADSEFGEKEK